MGFSAGYSAWLSVPAKEAGHGLVRLKARMGRAAPYGAYLLLALIMWGLLSGSGDSAASVVVAPEVS